jgi:uncharacterized membrane protein YdjX (TVP38/TMEM64 family)
MLWNHSTFSPTVPFHFMRFFPRLKSKWIWILGLLTVICIVLIYQYRSELWAQIVHLYSLFGSRRKSKQFILSFGAYSPIAFMLLQVLQVVVAPIPGGAIEFLGGYIFGVKGGFVYSMIGLFFGSWMAFALARIFEKWAVEKFVSPRTRKKFDYLIGHEGVILSFVLFLIPGFPKDALCYILGLTPMHTGIFLVVSTLGRIPGTLIATLQGAKAFDEQYRTFLILLGLSTLVILIFYIYHNEIHDMIKKWHKVKK